MSLSHYPVTRTLLSSMFSWCLYLTILGILLPLRVSGNELESDALVDFDIELNDDNCPENGLERQVERASIIFTGTVQNVLPHRKHVGQTKAHVEVKRIFKGRLVDKGATGYMLGGVSNNVVIIDGLDNPDICHSSVKPFDSRIFLVSENGNELKLNSPLIRVTLINLERVEAAVKHEVFIPKPEDRQDPCTTFFCPFHAQCTISASTGEAYCSCSKSCHSVFAPVCGTDNITYTSECHLSMASCHQQKRIQVQRPGSCSDPDVCADTQCGFGAVCVLSSDRTVARCQCRVSCSSSHKSIPICGSDGKDYADPCEMERASCTQMQNITKKYDGKCDPCQGFNCASGVCHVNTNREAVCRCGDIVCREETDFICASDGKTYGSECAMKKESCISRRKIAKLYAGKCPQDFDPCHGLQCKWHAECQVNNGKRECVCPGNCEPVIRPVCGNDRKTYDNECQLQRHSCISDIPISVIQEGFCAQQNSCSQRRCTNGAICSLINGQPSCVCPSCAQELDPVCGDNGISYSSECMLKAESCQRKENIVVLHKGPCSTCEKKCDFYGVCQLDSQNIEQCVCPTLCVEVENQVCGTDGVTYTNECELRVASCSSAKAIAIASEGSCGICANVKCRRGARCEKGKCICPHLCPDTDAPVCASNGITYANECFMRLTGCQQTMDLEVVQIGECDDQSGSGSGMEDGCQESTCQFGGICSGDSSGFQECKCKFTCPALRQTVCGSDGQTYGSECLMKEMSCKLQKKIIEQSVDNCEDIVEEMCEGTVPLIDPVTLKDYNCADDLGVCPAGSYCHRTAFGAKCCQEDTPISSCWDTAFGCCADNTTVAPGPRHAGCPGFCKCNPWGSLSSTCDPISRQCTCKPGVGGVKCNRCHPGYWHLPTPGQGSSGCLPCDCSPLGSVRDDCDQQTGRCLCRQGFAGPKCNTCTSGQPLGPQGCSGESSSSLFSCADVSCSHGAVCQLRNRVPQCICPFVCPHKDLSDRPLSVCGSDDQTYGSSCQLESFACRTQQTISVTFRGHCSSGKIIEAVLSTVHVHDVGTTTGLPFTRIHERDARKSYDLITSLQIEHSSPSTTSSVTMTSPMPHRLPRSKTPENRIGGKHKQLNSKTTLAYTTRYFFTTASTNTAKLMTAATSPVTIPSKEMPAEPKGASFLEKSYLQLYWSVSGNPNMSVEVTFIPQSPDGIIFYSGQLDNATGDFVSLALRDGFVEFGYELGSGPAVLRSREQVNMNQMNRVLGQRSVKDGSLKLNDFAVVVGTSKGDLTMLNLDKSPIYLGSIPATKDVLLKHTGMEMGFVGCIVSLEVSESSKVSKLYDLTYPGSSDVAEGSLSERQCSSFLKPESPCEPNPCESHGTCKRLATNNYTCICSTGRAGQRCEKVSASDKSVSFDGFTYHAYDNGITKPQYAQLSNKYELVFNTKADRGLLLLQQNGTSIRLDYLAIAINHGQVEASLNLGSEKPIRLFVIRSAKQINDNHWHTLLFSRNKTDVQLSIDGEVPVTAVLSPGANQLDTDGRLWIGGKAILPNGLPRPYLRGFRGCISSIKIDDRSLHLVEDRKTNNPLAFCEDP